MTTRNGSRLECSPAGSLPSNSVVPPIDVAARFGHAVALHQSGRLTEAEPLYRAVIEAQPSHFDALHLLGLLHYQRGEYTAALHQVDVALAVNPNAAAAHNTRGAALKELNRLDDAIESYSTAIGLNPS